MSDKSRRKLIKSIAAGSGAVIAGKSLPEKWTKPAIDSVLLPAHAQTSIGLFCESTGAPFADHVAPGPDVDTTSTVLLPWMAQVVPAPVAPNNEIFVQIYLDGELFAPGSTYTLAPDGTFNATGFASGINGVVEFRIAHQPSSVCSLFWNMYTTAPTQGGGTISLTQ